MTFAEISKRVDKQILEWKTACSVLEKAEEEMKEVTERLANITHAQILAQEIAQQVQESAHAQISGVVSRCLEAIFDEPYEFKIKFERKRGRTEAELVFCRDGMEIDPLDASGGGVVDVAAFALRVACLQLTSPGKRGLLVLDEPFKFVSQEYRGRIQSLLEILTKEMKIQIIMVSHIEELKTGKLLEL